jgi:dolichol-phosphate mannosyltransferase
MTKLFFPLDGPELPETIREIEPQRELFQLIVAHPDGGAVPALPGTAHRIKSSSGLPDFGAIHALLEAERPDACVLLNNTVFTKLCRLAAEIMSIPAFVFIDSEPELREMPPRPANRRGLFFFTDAGLLPLAATDPQYGSTLFYVGESKNGEPASFVSIVKSWSRDQLDSPNPALSVIVPAFREAGNLEAVCNRLLKTLTPCRFLWEILLVDDASPDDTYAHALEQMRRSPRIRALTKSTPRGMGYAIRHALARARAPMIAITMGDGSDEVERIPDMYTAVRDGGFALAIGTRYRRAENYANVPWIYRFWSRCFRFVSHYSTGLKLSDYTNAFRVFKKDIFTRYGAESGGFEISPEITFKAWLRARSVTEIDVCHLKRASGQSTFSFLKAGPGYGKILIKAVVARFTGRWFVLDW